MHVRPEEGREVAFLPSQTKTCDGRTNTFTQTAFQMFRYTITRFKLLGSSIMNTTTLYNWIKTVILILYLTIFDHIWQLYVNFLPYLPYSSALCMSLVFSPPFETVSKIHLAEGTFYLKPWYLKLHLVEKHKRFTSIWSILTLINLNVTELQKELKPGKRTLMRPTTMSNIIFCVIFNDK